MENADWASLVQHKSQPVFHVLVSHLESLYSYDEYNWFTKSTNDTEQYEHKNKLFTVFLRNLQDLKTWLQLF